MKIKDYTIEKAAKLGIKINEHYEELKDLADMLPKNHYWREQFCGVATYV
jgi:hypothetical protein